MKSINKADVLLNNLKISKKNYYLNMDLEKIDEIKDENLKKMVMSVLESNNKLFNELKKNKDFDVRYYSFYQLKQMFINKNIDKETILKIIENLYDDPDDIYYFDIGNFNEMENELDIWDLNFFELLLNISNIDKNNKDDIINKLRKEMFENKIYIYTFNKGKEKLSGILELGSNKKDNK
jgi:hypothetical protein